MTSRGQSSKLTRWLLNKNAVVETKDSRGRSPLHYVQDKTNIMSLLEAGANPNHTDINGFSPLHYAALEGASDRIKLLVQRGAELDLGNNEYGTPLHCAVSKMSHAATWQLMQAKAPVRAKNRQGDTALHLAVQTGKIGLVKPLLVHGADPSISNASGLTPTHLCASSGFTEALRAIFLYGPMKTGIDSASHASDMRTPLHLAALSVRIDAAQILLRHGAAVDRQDKNGDSPLLLACGTLSDKHVSPARANLYEVLLKRGASARVKKKLHKTPWTLSLFRKDYFLMNLLIRYDRDSCPENAHQLCFKTAVQEEDWHFVPTLLRDGLFDPVDVPTSQIDLPVIIQLAENQDSQMIQYIFQGQHGRRRVQFGERQIGEDFVEIAKHSSLIRLEKASKEKNVTQVMICFRGFPDTIQEAARLFTISGDVDRIKRLYGDGNPALSRRGERLKLSELDQDAVTVKRKMFEKGLRSLPP